MALATYFGIAGLLANTLWPLLTVRKQLLLGQLVACCLMFAHFYFLDAMTGALVMMVAGIQATLALPLEKHPNFKLVYAFSMLLTPALCWYTWAGWPSIFSSIALTFYCCANLHLKVTAMKKYLFLCIFAWFCHNSIVQSIPGLLSNLFALSTLIYSTIKPAQK